SVSAVTVPLYALVLPSYCLLFSPPADRRELHSFPTRRSSDLRSSRSGGTGPGAACARRLPRPAEWPRPARRALRRRGGPRRPARSEEHTSELQSRFDLVCRLLLEKKKNEAYESARAGRTQYYA